jgi:hypothetical protein
MIAKIATFIAKAAMVHIGAFANGALHKQRKEIPMKKFSTALLIALATCSAIAPQTAHAEDVATFKLKTRELDSVEGRTKLFARMKFSAKAECKRRSSSFYFDVAGCAKDLSAQWIAAIGNPALAALSSANGGRVAIAAD